MDSSLSWSLINSFNNKKSETLGFYRPCPVCGSLHSKKVFRLDDFQFYSDSAILPKIFDVSDEICLDCFAIYKNPCYSQVGFQILFAEAGQSYGSETDHTLEQIDWLRERSLLRDGSIVLDVGCFEGGFLSKLPDGVIKFGVDIDEPAIERGELASMTVG